MKLPLRSLLAAAAAAAVLAYGAAGHGLPQVSSHEGMAGSTIGICLLLVTVLGLNAMPRPDGPPRQIRPVALPVPDLAPAGTPLDGRARASPSALQRFRN
ncbi:MAG TPA: hypothetical protein VF879_02040 [Nitrospirales bacterium]